MSIPKFGLTPDSTVETMETTAIHHVGGPPLINKPFFRTMSLKKITFLLGDKKHHVSTNELFSPSGSIENLVCFPKCSLEVTTVGHVGRMSPKFYCTSTL